MEVAIFIGITLLLIGVIVYTVGYQTGLGVGKGFGLGNVRSYIERTMPDRWSAYKQGVHEGYEQGLRDGQEGIEHEKTA